jgi:hypothetical protein
MSRLRCPFPKILLGNRRSWILNTYYSLLWVNHRLNPTFSYVNLHSSSLHFSVISILIPMCYSSKVFLRSGHLAIYETLSGGIPPDQPTSPRAASLDIKFVKVVSKAYEIQRPEESAGEKSIIAEQKRVLRMFIPFVTSPVVGTTFSGVFFTGDRPCWILATDKGGVQVYPSGHNVVHAFTPCSLWESKGDFLLYSDEVSVLIGSLLSRGAHLSFLILGLVLSRAQVCWNGYLISSLMVPYQNER